MASLRRILDGVAQLDLRGTHVRMLLIELTRACTDRCPKCGVWKEAEPVAARCPLDRIEQCIVDLGARLEHVAFGGGEPLMVKEGVLRVGALCQARGLAMTVTTNGALADEAFLASYAAQGHTLIFSIDTLDPDRWVAFRGRDNRATVLHNLERAHALLGDKLQVQSVRARETLEDLPAVAAHCARAGIAHLIQDCQDFGGSWSPVAAPVLEDAPCEAWRDLCVYPNGDVVRCFDHHRIPAARLPLGNLKTESIDAILQKPRTQEITRMLQGCTLPCRQLACNRSWQSRPLQIVRGAFQRLGKLRPR